MKNKKDGLLIVQHTTNIVNPVWTCKIIDQIKRQIPKIHRSKLFLETIQLYTKIHDRTNQ